MTNANGLPYTEIQSITAVLLDTEDHETRTSVNQDFPRQWRGAFFLLVFLLCMTASVATAVDAEFVTVNGVKLDGKTAKYWNNAGGGSAADWNAFFDLSTPVPTLWLNDAEISAFSAKWGLITADGDIVLQLMGKSTLRAAAATAADPAGIIVFGDLTIAGAADHAAGSLTIDLTHTNATYNGFTDGIYVTYGGSITIQSGTIDITVRDQTTAYGLYASQGITMEGGAVTVTSTGYSVSAVAARRFAMSGGSIRVTAAAKSDSSRALTFGEAMITGGDGRFTAAENGYGLRITEDAAKNFSVLGGTLRFSGADAALFFSTDQPIVPTVSGDILVSTAADGSGKTRWNAAKGALATNNVQTSPFRYVELGSGTPAMPLTGDGSKPWLWASIGLAALLAGVGLIVYFKFGRK